MLICLLNLKFASCKRILLDITFSNLSGRYLYDAQTIIRRKVTNHCQEKGTFAARCCERPHWLSRRHCDGQQEVQGWSPVLAAWLACWNMAGAGQPPAWLEFLQWELSTGSVRRLHECILPHLERESTHSGCPGGPQESTPSQLPQQLTELSGTLKILKYLLHSTLRITQPHQSEGQTQLL